MHFERGEKNKRKSEGSESQMVPRVVTKVEFHCRELSPRVGFIVTSLAASSRGWCASTTSAARRDQLIKEGKQAVAMTRLSCHSFRAN